MALEFWVTEFHFVVVKDGIGWQRSKDLKNPPNITACDCCIPDEIKSELKKIGIIPSYQDFTEFEKNSGTHPTEEEWLAVKIEAEKDLK